MAFLGQDPVACKIFVENRCLQQVRTFKYLGREISSENGKDIQQKLAKFAQILGIETTLLNQLWSRNFQEYECIMH
jgi:hypothetical protein